MRKIHFSSSPSSIRWRCDPGYLLAIILLMSLGLIMVTSASIGIAEKRFHQPFYYAWHQAVYLGLGLLTSIVVFSLPIKFWEKIARPLVFVALLCLFFVLIPGLGKNVNGSTRWLNLGLVTIQISELVKFCIILYLASYIVRQRDRLQNEFLGFVRPMLLLSVISGLLLLEPDFGATVVIMSTAMSMLFLAGVPFYYFFGLCVFLVLAFAGLAISAPYRLQRLTAFLDPWAYQFDSGYQLTQALIAFGRGEWFGVGLGSSVQKLFYLPEAHTDFIFAVLAEELGLIGGLCVIGLYTLLVVRGMVIGLCAEKRGALFAAFACYGITVWIGLQALISMGVNTGLLPTKGLTLPFISYGGSSLLVLCVAVALIFRIDFENRNKHFQMQRNNFGSHFGK